MSDKVQVFDTTLRDGEQSAGVLFSEDDKRRIAEQLAALRVDVIEAGFPAASPAEARAVARIAREVRGARICALARAVPVDIEAAAEALRGGDDPRIHVFVNASEMQLAHQLHKSRQEVIELARKSVKLARSRVADVEFSPMDATRAEPEFLAELVRSAIAAGAIFLETNSPRSRTLFRISWSSIINEQSLALFAVRVVALSALMLAIATVLAIRTEVKK